MIPHFDGERTPNKPRAKGSFYGITHSNFTKENIARASIEGVIAGMIYAARAVERLGVSYSRILLIGVTLSICRSSFCVRIAMIFFLNDR